MIVVNKIQKNIFLLLFLVFLNSGLVAQKIDEVILINGDHITCEIKKLEYSILVCKTDDMGTLNIEWQKIASILAKSYYEVEMRAGQKYYGSIDSLNSNKRLIVKGYSGSNIVLKDSVVKITTIKSGIWEKIDGNISFGFSYAKANQLGNLNFGSELYYRTEKFYNNLSLSALLNTTEQTTSSETLIGSFVLKRLLDKKWSIAGFTSFEHNTELGIKLRGIFGSGVGYTFLQDNNNSLNTVSGLMFNRESFIDSSESQSSLEIAINTEYRRFVHHFPKMQLTSKLNLSPSITEWGRIRGNFDIEMKWEIFADFTWSLSFLYNSDLNWKEGHVSKIDWNIDSAFGYTL